jgi:formate dehydrogenase subunit delta
MENRDMLRMANQIADFFRSYPHDDAVKEAATHLNNYWDPRMRKHFFDYLAEGGEGFDPLIIEAAAQVRKPKMDTA